MGFFDKIKEGLRKTRENISGSIESMLHSFTKIDEELFEELEELLVMGDVGIHTAGRICDELRVRVKKEGVTDPNQVMDLLKETVADLLSGGQELQIANKPAAILVIGVNGVGKTTTIGKIAARLKSEGNSVVLGAADTFRAAAIDQLEVWADRAGVPLVKRDEGSDPASVVFDTIAKAKSIGADVLICDTAGRLHNKKNLMDELGKMSRIIDRELPGSDKEVLLVLDATTGQNAVNQAREFKNAAGITGIVLTKLDGTAKGGVVLAIREELQLPVKFIGVGEKLDDLQPFDARDFAEALFDTESRVDEDTMARIAEQNARYDEYGELIDDGEAWPEDERWETGTEAGDAAAEAADVMAEVQDLMQEAAAEALEEPDAEAEQTFHKESRRERRERARAERIAQAEAAGQAEEESPMEQLDDASAEQQVADGVTGETAAEQTVEAQPEPQPEPESETPGLIHGSDDVPAEEVADSVIEETATEQAAEAQPEPQPQPEPEPEPEYHKETWRERREREKAERRAQEDAAFGWTDEDTGDADEEWVEESHDSELEEEAPQRETREERKARKEREKAEKRAQKEARKEERRFGRRG